MERHRIVSPPAKGRQSAEAGYTLRVNSRNKRQEERNAGLFLFTWICSQSRNFSFGCLFRDSCQLETKLELISFRRRLFAAGFCVSFLGSAVIKLESSSSPLHVHALFENFYRTKAIRDGKHVTTYTLCRIESRKEEVAVRLGRFLLKQEASSVWLLADRKTRQRPRLDVRP